MRGSPKDRGVINHDKWDEKDAKKTWSDIIPESLWNEMVTKLNLSSEYVKGTQTAHRNVTYQSYLNKLAEEFRCNSQRRYRTDSEIFRVAIHLGINILYNIFIKKAGALKKSRSMFFYEALQEIESNMERATMAHIMNSTKAELSKKVNKGKMTHEEAVKELKKFWKTIPEEDLEYVKKYLSQHQVDNVRNIGEDLLKDVIT